MSRNGHAPAVLRRAVAGRERIEIRRAGAGDGVALRRLAQLADRRVPQAPVLLAESDGKLLAAVSTASGEVVSDPFAATGDVVALLRLRARQLDEAA